MKRFCVVLEKRVVSVGWVEIEVEDHETEDDAMLYIANSSQDIGDNVEWSHVCDTIQPIEVRKS